MEAVRHDAAEMKGHEKIDSLSLLAALLDFAFLLGIGLFETFYNGFLKFPSISLELAWIIKTVVKILIFVAIIYKQVAVWKGKHISNEIMRHGINCSDHWQYDLVAARNEALAIRTASFEKNRKLNVVINLLLLLSVVFCSLEMGFLGGLEIEQSLKQQYKIFLLMFTFVQTVLLLVGCFEWFHCEQQLNFFKKCLDSLVELAQKRKLENAGWTVHTDEKTGETFFFHADSNQSQWLPPTEKNEVPKHQAGNEDDY